MRNRWVDLRDKHNGRLYGRYCPKTKHVEFAKGRQRIVIDLKQYDSRSVDESDEKC